jgi:hypothetical protein
MELTMMEGQALEPVASTVLHPWMLLAEQAVVDAELYAVVAALEALLWERSALYWLQVTLRWLSQDCPLWYVAQAFSCLLAAQADVQRALERWQAAVHWLQEYGEPSRAQRYRALANDALVQQQRLEQKMAQVRHAQGWVCATWGVSASVLLELLEPHAEEGGA